MNRTKDLQPSTINHDVNIDQPDAHEREVEEDGELSQVRRSKDQRSLLLIKIPMFTWLKELGISYIQVLHIVFFLERRCRW